MKKKKEKEKKRAGVSGGQPNLHILWPLRFHQEIVIFSLRRPVCPDIPNFARFDDCCFTSNVFFQV